MSTLSERAMLVSLHIGSYTGMMHDKAITEEVNEQYEADKMQAGRYNKRLVASKFLRGVSTAHRQASSTHKLLTLPWEDDGTRILSTRGYINYQQKMRERRNKVEDLVKEFVKGLPEYIDEAKVRLGNMFREEDYPSMEVLQSKFSFDIEIKSMPNASDFRAKLPDDAIKSIVTDIEKRSKVRLENAINDVFQRVVPLLTNMVDRLKAYEPASEGSRTKGNIRDSLVYNIYELAETMPVLNVTDDPRIDQLRDQLVNQLVDPASPEILRSDTKARQTAIANAERILKKVQGYLK